MSESERMPGYLKRSHVPPSALRASSTANVRRGHLSCRWYAAPIPEIPAPTISTSKCSTDMLRGANLLGRGRHALGKRIDLGHRETPAVSNDVAPLEGFGGEHTEFGVIGKMAIR